jgi:hypothetical protein
MKDLPHHMNKLNRSVIRSQHREEGTIEHDDYTPPRPQTERQLKKQAKAELTKSQNERIPTHPSEEERNQKMKHRVPIFDRNNQTPKRTKSSHKKTPRI